MPDSASTPAATSRSSTWDPATARSSTGAGFEASPLRDGDELRLGQALVVLRFLGGAPRSPASSPDAPELSAREREVAELVAEGLTNAQIGRRLHISPATVGRHLSNIYERLGIHSRAALARVVLTGRPPPG